MRDLLVQGARIDSFGIGERLITSKSEPVFGGVYKLAAVENEAGEIVPKIKVSENVEKITTPHFKQVYRLFDNKSARRWAMCSRSTMRRSPPPCPMCCSTRSTPGSRRSSSDFTVRPLRVQLFKAGRCVYKSPAIREIRDYCQSELDTLWDQIKRFENPQTYYVDLSLKLWNCKNELLAACRI